MSDDERPRPLSRRRLLALSLATGLGAGAGCAGGDGTATSPTPTTTRTDDATESPTSTGTRTTETTTREPTTGGTTTDAPAEAVTWGAASPSSRYAPGDGFGSLDWLESARGLQVLKVTNLDAAGEGSLRWALDQRWPRVVVFEVGGTIDLGRNNIAISDDQVFVAGQTAPSPGVTLVRGGVVVNADDVVLQHLRVRPGDAGQPARSGWQPDAVRTAGRNNVVDHCSITWGVDETLSSAGGADGGTDNRNLTFANSIVAEGLRHASHRKGAHSKGSLIMDNTKRVAIANNLYAHNESRNPLFSTGATGVVVNNAVHNPGRKAVHFAATAHGNDFGLPRVAAVGNRLVPGPDTKQRVPFVSEPGAAYAAFNDPGGHLAVGSAVERLDRKPVWPSGFPTPLLPASLTDPLLATVGARPADRTPHDRRLVRGVRERTGRIIDSQRDVGGYPDLERTERSLDVPERDGLPAWLRGHTRAVELPGASAPD